MASSFTMNLGNLLLLAASFVCVSAQINPTVQILNDLRLARLDRLNRITPTISKRQTTTTFPSFNFTQPLDHFTDTGFTWNQRYFVNSRHYKPGGPVFVLDGGETSVTDRLPYLDTGIVDILASATNGLGVILEHRYYGVSVPVQNFTTDSLRWLNNEQAVADSANFMQNVQFDGIDADLTAPKTPWIYYGGSYAGARSAHMKVLHPDIVYGAIASSGVVEAAISNWGYYDIIRRAAPANCSAQFITAVEEVDALLSDPATNNKVKSFFGMPGLTLDADLMSFASGLLASWQSKNWDPAVNSDDFANTCTAMGNPSTAQIQTFQGFTVSNATWNLATIINQTSSMCPATSTSDECFGTIDDSEFQQTDLSQTWRAWQFQVCTQWGFFDSPPPNSTIPSMLSKFVDVAYSSKICQQAYPPGQFFQVPAMPNIDDVNQIGGFNIAHDMLAIIDGEVDPWRFDCAHSFISPSASRPDTPLRPFKLIPDAVHHYDENGLADHSQEPPAIQAIHSQEVEFVQGWLADFE
ncbi:peptidase S28 [Roridomyces roridus]|uniref:Peptidase S28 n=1 Tax=Roridomyces roridus TaxID=1738132 RepID=A0AAD7FGP7_9AGAR|nr:peptidase S28 [Roridomyces roridus]